MKQCIRCNCVKTVDDFYKHRTASDGRHPCCKTCVKARQHELYFNDPIVNARKKAVAKAWKQNNPRRAKAQHLKMYDLSIDEYEDLQKQQNSKCAVCHQLTELYVDHNHTTGIVRGLLCRLCNLGLGYFRDNVLLLEAAKTYLNPEPEVK